MYYTKGEVSVKVRKDSLSRFSSRPWSAFLSGEDRAVISGYKTKKALVKELNAMGFKEDPHYVTNGWIDIIHCKEVKDKTLDEAPSDDGYQELFCLLTEKELSPDKTLKTLVFQQLEENELTIFQQLEEWVENQEATHESMRKSHAKQAMEETSESMIRWCDEQENSCNIRRAVYAGVLRKIRRLKNETD